jgi:hypothetical protein
MNRRRSPGPGRTARGDATQVNRAIADVVDGGAREFPVVRNGFLVQRENVHFVRARQPPDQRQQDRDHAELAAAIHPARHHQREFHPALHCRSSSTCA